MIISKHLILLKEVLQEEFTDEFIRGMTNFRRGIPKKKREQIYNITKEYAYDYDADESEKIIEEDEELKESKTRLKRLVSTIIQEKELANKLLILKKSVLNYVGL
jgi:hypothetical protein